jgi:hypothetical protein
MEKAVWISLKLDVAFILFAPPDVRVHLSHQRAVKSHVVHISFIIVSRMAVVRRRGRKIEMMDTIAALGLQNAQARGCDLRHLTFETSDAPWLASSTDACSSKRVPTEWHLGAFHWVGDTTVDEARLFHACCWCSSNGRYAEARRHSPGLFIHSMTVSENAHCATRIAGQQFAQLGCDGISVVEGSN